MCIIINRKKGDAVITNKWLWAFWEKNNDGWGLMYHDESAALKVEKGLTYDSMKKVLRQIESKDLPFIIHMRMATHGAVDYSMLHPFELGPDMWFMHNGIVDYPEEKGLDDADHSDTYLFVFKVLRPLIAAAVDPSVFIRSDSFRFLLESHLGKHNRAVIMDAYGHVIYNAAIWHVIPSTKLHVSNTYAWSDPYAKPVKVLYSWPHMNKRQSKEPANPLAYDPSIDYEAYDDIELTAPGFEAEGALDISEGDINYRTILDAVCDSPEGAARALYVADQHGVDIWGAIYGPTVHY